MLDRFPHTASIDGVRITPYRTSPGRSVEAEPKDRKWFGLSLSEPDKLYLEGSIGGMALGGAVVFGGFVLAEDPITTVTGLAFLAVVIVGFYAMAYITSSWGLHRQWQADVKAVAWKTADENEILRHDLARARAQGKRGGDIRLAPAQEWMN